MASKSFMQLLLFTLLSLTLAVNASGATGDWTPIEDTNDPRVVDKARFAVTEYNKQSKAGLAYKKVVKAEMQIVSSGSVNFRLNIEASTNNGVNSGIYEAVVWFEPLHLWKLVSFKMV